MGGKYAVYRVATSTFDSMAAIQAGMASPQDQATAADLVNVASV